MKIEQIRVYAEVLEQGIDFKEYIIDTALINKFSPLINENGKLAGELSYPEIYVIQ